MKINEYKSFLSIAIIKIKCNFIMKEMRENIISNGKWQTGNGKWKTANGKWQMEDRKWTVKRKI